MVTVVLTGGFIYGAWLELCQTPTGGGGSDHDWQPHLEEVLHFKTNTENPERRGNLSPSEGDDCLHVRLTDRVWAQLAGSICQHVETSELNELLLLRSRMCRWPMRKMQTFIHHAGICRCIKTCFHHNKRIEDQVEKVNEETGLNKHRRGGASPTQVREGRGGTIQRHWPGEKKQKKIKSLLFSNFRSVTAGNLMSKSVETRQSFVFSTVSDLRLKRLKCGCEGTQTLQRPLCNSACVTHINFTFPPRCGWNLTSASNICLEKLVQKQQSSRQSVSCGGDQRGRHSSDRSHKH